MQSIWATFVDDGRIKMDKREIKMMKREAGVASWGRGGEGGAPKGERERNEENIKRPGW